MMNRKLADAVVALNEIQKIVEEQCGTCRTSIEIERCAEQVRLLSTNTAEKNNDI